jgi:hypothetical protein
VSGRQLETVTGALTAHGQGLEGQGQVVGGRCRAGQVEHPGHRSLDRERHRDVGFDEGEAAVVGQVGHIGPTPGREVVDADDLVAPGEQEVAEVGAEEARSAEDGDASGHRRPIPT